MPPGEASMPQSNIEVEHIDQTKSFMNDGSSCGVGWYVWRRGGGVCGGEKWGNSR